MPIWLKGSVVMGGVSFLVASCLAAAAVVVVIGLVSVVAFRWGWTAGVRRHRRRLAVPAVMSLALAVPGVLSMPAPQAVAIPEEHTSTLRYGPLLLPPNLGAHGGHGGTGGHGGQPVAYVAPTYEMPCQNCYVTGLEPDLVHADGSPANYHSGVMLHHMVLFDPFRSDPTCGRRGLVGLSGQRVFAAGNERTGAHLPAGYGYHLGSRLLGAAAELMNMSAQPQQVYVTMKVSWVDADNVRLKNVIPVWLDIDNCGDSRYTIPAGASHTTRTWTSTMTGDIVTVGGHVHDHGISITLSNADRAERICESVAGYGTDPHYRGHIESMSTCVGAPVATVRAGDRLVIDSYYDSPGPDDTVMGIMLVYLHETQG